MDVALDAALVLFVVERQLEAQGAGSPGEVFGGLVGVGAVDGEDADRQAERGVTRQDGDRVRAEFRRKANYSADASERAVVARRAGACLRPGSARSVPYLAARRCVPAVRMRVGNYESRLKTRSLPGPLDHTSLGEVWFFSCQRSRAIFR
ncbi:hypothetical protein [Nonomuraea sp. NPDC048916]|uniref:hypothetical protein n=1 Tax=Nonomuraea sp. NPDC048916 TaxID=3154232 RepID=UPI0033DF6B53